MADLSPADETPSSPEWSAWCELVGYVRHAAEKGYDITTTEIYDYMQDLHERNGLPSRWAPKRTETLNG